MKNIRAFAAGAAALALAASLSACTPPHQKDSDKAVSSVTTGPETPQVDGASEAAPTSAPEESTGRMTTQQNAPVQGQGEQGAHPAPGETMSANSQ